MSRKLIANRLEGRVKTLDEVASLLSSRGSASKRRNEKRYPPSGLAAVLIRTLRCSGKIAVCEHQ